MDLFNRISLPRLFRILPIFFVGLLIAQTAQEAAAQTKRPKKEAFTITVKMDGENCLYEILDYADQDTFRVSPGGKITFKSLGVLAAIDIAAQADGDRNRGGNNGKSGVENRNDRSFDLAAGGEKTVNAKSNNGSKSVHKVGIICIVNDTEIVSDSGPAVEDASLAVRRISAVRAPSTLTETERRDKEGPGETTTETDPVRGTGGPGMEIDPEP